MHLYEIRERYRAVLNDLENYEGNDEFKQALNEALIDAQDDFEKCAEQIALYINELAAEDVALKAEEQRLAARREANDKKVERLKGYLKDQMLLINIKKIKTPFVTLLIQKNPPSVAVDEQLIPGEFYEEKVVRNLRRFEIRERLLRGEAITGATLLNGTRLSIK
jgi:arginine/lysine/ornithine decarboxylase